jgi:hypothetical protein
VLHPEEVATDKGKWIIDDADQTMPDMYAIVFSTRRSAKIHIRKNDMIAMVAIACVVIR